MADSTRVLAPIFVVGMQRSGTTLMRSLLSAHPRITIAAETHFINRFMQETRLPELRDGNDFEAFWNNFAQSDRFRDLHIDAERTAAAVRASGDYRYQNVFEITLREYAARSGKPRWGEKTPHHAEHVETLLEWFPSARIIYMVRDPRAVSASLLLVPWRGSSSNLLARVDPIFFRRWRRVYADAVAWQRSLLTFLERWRPDRRVRAIRYEDLVAHPEKTLREVSDFVEEAYDPQMLEKRSWKALSSSPTGVDNWSRGHLERTLRPVTDASVEKWRDQLSPTEIAIVETQAREGMEKMGYEPAGLRETLQSGAILQLARSMCAAYWRVRPVNGPVTWGAS